MIERRIPYYEMKNIRFRGVEDNAFLGGKFVLKLPVLPKEKKEEVLVDAGDCLRVELICRSETDTDALARAAAKENGFYFNREKEWFLLTTFVMSRRHSDDRESFQLFLPLSMPCLADAELCLCFDGVFMRYLGNGEILNENAGQDVFPYTDRLACADGVCVACEFPPLSARYERDEKNADFYSPRFYNAYTGDVMNFYHDGVYHLLYLIDRRHHGSRNGAGAHYIAHLTTRDFINWREEEPVVTFDVPYESHGTGTMLYHDGRYYMSYGLHTERYIGEEGLGLLAYEQNGTLARELPETEFLKKGLFPAGATYAVSEDGIHFEKSHNIFHVGRNPSVYTNEKGGISLYVGYDGKGTWESDGFGKPFRQIVPDFPPVGTLPMRQTGECPSFFSMNGYRYLIMGFTGYFRTLSPSDETYTDVSAAGEEIYDGLCVPMVASVGERRLIAGWLDGVGWGSVAVHRELICLESGRLGMKWIPELVPLTKDENLLENVCATAFALPEKQSFLFSAMAEPNTARRLAFVFTDGEGKGCEICFDRLFKRMQAAPAEAQGFAPAIATMAEQFTASDPTIDYYGHTGCKQIPRYSADFSLGGMNMLDKPFAVRLLVRYSHKLGATVIDAEVGGERTLITVRRGFYPTRMELRTDGDAAVRNMMLARLLHEVE